MITWFQNRAREVETRLGGAPSGPWTAATKTSESGSDVDDDLRSLPATSADDLMSMDGGGIRRTLDDIAAEVADSGASDDSVTFLGQVIAATRVVGNQAHVTCCRGEISWSRGFTRIAVVLSWSMASVRLVLCASFPVIGKTMPTQSVVNEYTGI